MKLRFEMTKETYYLWPRIKLNGNEIVRIIDNNKYLFLTDSSLMKRFIKYEGL